MARRSTPDRLYAARRAGVIARLVDGHRLSRERAEALMSAWEAEAAQRGLERLSDAFRRECDAWLRGQLDRS